MHFGMPLVQCYHLLCASIFLNVAAEDAKGLEKVANYALTPVQYALVGSKAVRVEGENTYVIEQHFTYTDAYMWHKTVLSYAVLPVSVVVGGTLKALSYLSSDVRQRHHALVESLSSTEVRPMMNYYESVGIAIQDFAAAEFIDSPSHKRRPGEENILKEEKEALKEILAIFNANKILCWMDCGSCLGAYRYGGIIPWDWDVDLAILQPDFDNAKKALQALDKEKYSVQDWSSRDKPKAYLKVYVKATGVLIDIYHFAIDKEKGSIHSVLANEGSVFLPESWKIRERRYTIDTPFDIVFPLKKANFDGIEVWVPRQTKKYLQQRYGENIEPVKIYNEVAGIYEKDLSHPYWQNAYAQ